MLKQLLVSFLFCSLVGVFTVTAQINSESPFPVDFLVNSPSSIAGQYDYGTQSTNSTAPIWGPELSQTVSGDLVWAFDDTDSLACSPVVTDLTGKMALIRRGACGFSLKTWHAQEAGAVGVIICNHYDNADEDENTIFGMLGVDSAALVTIPAIFASRATCERIVPEVDAGNTVNVSFAVRSFSTPVVAYSYHTPLAGERPLTAMGINYTNLGMDPLAELNITVDITDPSGNTTSITQTENDLPSLMPLSITFDEAYTPTEVGTYNYHFSNDETDEEFDGVFVVTESTFAQDNGMGNDWIAPSSDGFIEDGLVYHFGNFYRSGVEPTTVTHVSFQLYNAADLFTGDPEADAFTIIIYDADPDGNGVVPGNAESYAALDEGGGSDPIVGFGSYSLTGNETADQLITVELDEPLELGADKIYLTMVQYNGADAGLGIPPQYGFGGNHDVAGGLGSCVFTNRLYIGGWVGGAKGVIRMHLDGFVDAEEVLDQSKVALSPSPASTQINLELELEKVADEVNVRILDFTGRLVNHQVFENVQSGNFSFDVSSLAVGTYFMSIETPEGYRAKKFVVVR
ncbi:MAG TPA: T9SS type A sorting domain-containing protein [Bacteroidetes bacterium]|nr:T9SS type A sorting domain-containing protein [Bacteroidota bacterium]